MNKNIIILVLALALIIVSAKMVMAQTSDTKEVSPKSSTAVVDNNHWKSFDVKKDFQGNPFTWFKGSGLLLAAGDKTGYNEMTIGWGALGNLWAHDNATITVYVAQSRYTHQYMEKTKYFTVMTFDAEHQDILHYMGSHSGRDGDKVKALGLHTRYTSNGTPYFEEASEVYECKIIYHAPFDPKGFGELPKEFYAHFPAGIHSQYIGEVVGAWKKSDKR